MNKTRTDLEKTLKEISLMLNDKSTTFEEKERLEKMAAEISGTLMKNWLPNGRIQLGMMGIIVLIILYGMINISGNFLFLGIILILFSPRMVGEIISIIRR
ncbi:MAG: hypothetical protein PHY14_04395 [Candidatus Gracilibacteria bacterium]|nr:hypothetical protein [Candidatus Gracilibacteria bacterium]